MRTSYVQTALRLAHYERLPDGEGTYGSVAALPGVWTSAPTQEACREELREVIEEWVLIRLRRGASMPVLEGIDLNAPTADAATPLPIMSS